MREIKFRAWDNENNNYFEPTYRAYQGELKELLMQPSGRLLLRKIENGIETLYGESLFQDRFTLEQFTGLKDKNGKEIYEGDVVRFTRNTGPIYKPTITSDVGVIKWVEEKSSFRLCYRTQQQKLNSSYSSKYEIIGNIKNINDNHELVEAKE